MPWKNGKGLTREIALLPSDGERVPFHFRLSMASLGDPGPFSLFPGIERTIVPLDGGGFALKQGEAPQHWVSRLEAFTFRGDSATVMTEVKASTLDLNVMIDPLWGRCSVNLVHRSGALALDNQRPAALQFFVAIDQVVAVKLPELATVPLLIPPLGSLLLSDLALTQATVDFGPGGALIWGTVLRR